MAANHKNTGCLVWLLVVLASSIALQAQIDRARIAGIVIDPSGAAVAGATVTVTNLGTGRVASISTASDGSYSATNLQIGNYSVEAVAPGFRKTVQSDIQLNVNDVVRVDLKLTLGSVTEQTVVTEAPPLLATETSSLGTVETGRRIVDLPLNGRNFTQLAWLGPATTPGATNAVGLNGSTDDNRPGISLSVNGLYGFDNNFLLDGVDNNGVGDGTIAINPAPDAIGEFRLEENSMKAEFGRGGAAVNAALKSGTNQIHGGAYEYLRNDGLDAKNYFNTGSKAPLHRNQFGFYLGGPIIKNRTFIFGDYQGSRLHEGLTFVSTVPTAKERTGDFTEIGAVLYDPKTTQPNGSRQPLNPSNPSVIPANRIDQVGQNVANFFPLPNQPGLTANYVLTPNESFTGNQFDIRVDHKINDTNQLFGHAAYENHPGLSPAPLGPAGGCCAYNVHTRQQNYAAGFTHVFRPTLLNDLRFAFVQYKVNSTALNSGQNISQSLGIPNANRGTSVTSGLANISYAGYANMGNSFYIPELSTDNTYQLADSVSWVRGKHTIKFGVDYRRYTRDFYQSAAPFGQFSFSGQLTQNLAAGVSNPGGNAIADLLLGLPVYREQDGLENDKDLTHSWELAEFFQDDIRVNNRLTLNLGLRYDTISPVGGQKVGNFDFTKAVVVNNFGPNGVSNAGVGYYHKDFGPRVGFSWSPYGNGKTVISSAFGMFYSPQGNQYNDLGENPPVLLFYQLVTPPTTIPSPATMLDAGFPAQLPGSDPAHPSGQVKTTGPVRKAPKILEWNLSLQQELAPNWLLHVAYVGTRATGIWNNENSNLNQPVQPLDTNFSDPTGNMGRPYFSVLPNLAVINPIDYPNFDIFYNALQTKLEKRFSQGLTLLGSYTWSHDIGTHQGSVTGSVPVQNAHNVAGDRGNVDPDYRNRFVLSVTYELPFGRGRRFASGMNRVADAFVGGWQISDITTIRSGEAFTPVLSADDTNTGTGARPDMIHDPKDFSFDIPRQQQLGCPGGHQSLTCWYNPAAFVQPALAPGQSVAHEFGDTGNGALRGPDQVNFDFAIHKNFAITERHQLQFRAEMFNVFNHPQFALPSANPDVPGGAQITSTLRDNQREVQLSLRYSF
jgi:hypothetical protein